VSACKHKWKRWNVQKDRTRVCVKCGGVKVTTIVRVPGDGPYVRTVVVSKRASA